MTFLHFTYNNVYHIYKWKSKYNLVCCGFQCVHLHVGAKAPHVVPADPWDNKNFFPPNWTGFDEEPLPHVTTRVAYEDNAHLEMGWFSVLSLGKNKNV